MNATKILARRRERARERAIKEALATITRGWSRLFGLARLTGRDDLSALFFYISEGMTRFDVGGPEAVTDLRNATDILAERRIYHSRRQWAERRRAHLKVVQGGAS